MINLKRKINSVKKAINYKYNKLKKRLHKFTYRLHKAKVNSFLGYSSIIGFASLIVGINLVNFMIVLTIEYPELNISMNNQNYIASMREANMIIEKNSDTENNKLKQEQLERNIEIKAINEEKQAKQEKNKIKLTYAKLKYKKSIIEKYGNAINDISIENKENYISKIENFILKLNALSVNGGNNDEIIYSTAKLLAFKELLSESLEYTEHLNSALEEPNKDKYIPDNTSSGKMTTWGGKVTDDEIKTTKIKKPKTEKKFEVPVTIDKPKVENKKIIEVPIINEPKPGIIPPSEKKKDTKEEKVFEVPAKKPHPCPQGIHCDKFPSTLEEKEAAVELNSALDEVEVEVVEPEIKKVVVVVVVKTTDSISININNEKNKILDNLNADIFRNFKIKVVQKDNLLLENGVWYTYVYSKYQNFGKGVVPSESSLTRGGLNKETTILLLDNNIGASFVNDYKKVKLISDYIISGIANKHEFLIQLADDKKYLHNDTDNLFLKLKKDTLQLTKGVSNSAKIYKIYDYILRNISYSKTFSTADKKIFSGISTFQNKAGICGGYTKLNLYMLSFAGVSNAQIVKGDVIDAADFPSIGHAWIRIGSKYYDPTFDDPTGVSGTKSYDQYKFFGLPKDLFYTNRYNHGTLPGYLKTETLENRKTLIKNNLLKYVDKYKNNNYILLKQFIFRQNNNIANSEKITIDKLKNIIPYFEVKNYKITENNETKKVSNIDYYTITDSNTEILLEQISYNLEGYKLFKWDDGSHRLAYKSTIN